MAWSIKSFKSLRYGGSRGGRVSGGVTYETHVFDGDGLSAQFEGDGPSPSRSIAILSDSQSITVSQCINHSANWKHILRDVARREAKRTISFRYSQCGRVKIANIFERIYFLQPFHSRGGEGVNPNAGSCLESRGGNYVSNRGQRY